MMPSCLLLVAHLQKVQTREFNVRATLQLSTFYTELNLGLHSLSQAECIQTVTP